jgi:hypothetical protein
MPTIYGAGGVQMEEEKAKPQRLLRNQAIALAMQSRWEEAVEANRNLIAAFPTDVDAYNQLGRALMELGRYAEAKEAYGKALELQPNNAIAKKSLERLSVLRRREAKDDTYHQTVSPDLFVREMGKSRVVRLYHTGPKEVLAQMTAGDQVYLNPRGKHLAVENAKRQVLGWVEPKYEVRLLRLMRGGNKYAAAIVSVDGEVKVIINETYQHPSQAGKLSFPVEPVSGTRPGGKESLLRRAEEELEEFEAFEEETGEGEEEGELIPEGFTVMEGGAQIEEALVAKEEEEEQ